jgi:membrane-associated phospholipid phosphatase
VDPAGRRLIVAALVAFGAFGALTAAVLAGLPLGPDVAVTRAVQAVSWGPLVPAFDVVDYLDGWRQVVLAGTVVVTVFLLSRPAARVALVCTLSAGAYSVLQFAVHRPRPPAGLVHVLRHPPGYSYPSGHAVFYTWALAVLVLALAARRPRLALFAAPLAALLLMVVLLGRIYAGEHWPSDCLAGLLLGGGWTLAALGLPRVGRPVRRRLRPLLGSSPG